VKAGPVVCARRLAGLLLVSTSIPVWAQAEPPPARGEHITVVGEREVLGVLAERSLSQDDISTYGLGTIGELLDEVAAESGEGRDEPVFLVNGERIADLGEVENYPTEALERVDVLPVGAGAKVGATVTKRV
jgi:hypothetical protein